MAKIDIYNAKGLAQQAVGTPGIDPTGETISDLGSTISKATDKYIEAETAKLKLANNGLAEAEKIKFENQQYLDYEKAKQDIDNMNNPYGLAERSYDDTDAARETYAKNITNPQVREMFLLKTAITPGQVQTTMNKWAGQQTTTNALVSVNESIDAITLQASKMKDLNGILGCISQVDSVCTNNVGVLGTQKAYELSKHAKKEVVSQALYANIDLSPGTVQGWIKSGKLDGILDEQDQHSVLRTAGIISKRNVTEQKAAQKAAFIASGQQVATKVYTGKATLNDINSEYYRLKSLGYGDSSKPVKALLTMREAVVQQGGLSYATTNSYEAVSMIDGAMANFSTNKKKGTATLDDVVHAQAILYTNGVYLSEGTYNKYQEKINNEAASLVKNNKYAGKLNNLKKTSAEGLKSNWDANVYDLNLYEGYKVLDSRYSGNQANLAKGIYSTIYDGNYARAKEQCMKQTGKWRVGDYRRWVLQETIRRMGG